MVCVLPGVFDTLAKSFLLVIKLMREDFPTLLLPINANSGNSEFGQSSVLGKAPINFADCIKFNYI
jgi:hypothetical protein